jgi:hypothetical protein
LAYWEFLEDREVSIMSTNAKAPSALRLLLSLRPFAPLR